MFIITVEDKRLNDVLWKVFHSLKREFLRWWMLFHRPCGKNPWVLCKLHNDKIIPILTTVFPQIFPQKKNVAKEVRLDCGKFSTASTGHNTDMNLIN